MLEEYQWGKDLLKDREIKERIDVLRRSLSGEISNEEAQRLHAEIADKYRPLYEKREQTEKAFERDDPYTDLGYKRSKEEEGIPAAAKAVTKHRTACGVKLSDKDLARFWSKINVKSANQCWPWKNSTRGSLGYGQFRIGDRICDAHRIALELMKGPLKKGRYILHDCDNPKCCNPRHLIAGTQKGNMNDMTEKGRGDN
jgi:hypothetical protein